MIFFVQIGWILFSLMAGPEEAAWSWPFRNLASEDSANPPQFRKADKDEQSEKAHKWGWLSVAVIGIVLAYAATYAILQKLDFIYFGILLVSFIAEYSMMFDGSYGISIGKNFFYLGNTAKTDKRIGTKGKLKFFVCLAVTIGLNIVLNIFW